MSPLSRIILCTLAALSLASAEAPGQSTKELHLGVKKWQIVERESGPVDYYAVIADGEMPYIRAHYKPPNETAVLGYMVADGDHQRARGLRWKWRVHNLPPDGNECVEGKGDSAAGVFLLWKRGMRVYSLKYMWSTVAPKGAVCDKKRGAFVARDKIVLESGAPLNVWQTEELDIKAEFRRHFEDGNPDADVPDFLGVGIMTDGDQTNTEVVADYADFVLTR